VFDVFVVPNSWFGIFDDMAPVIAQACLDGSYQRDPHPAGRIFAYGGWIGFDDAWRLFAPAWNATLAARGIEYFRSAEMRHRPDFEELRQTLAKAAKESGLHAIGKSADVNELGPKDGNRKRDLFEAVVRQMLSATPIGANLALLCDREQDLAKEVDAWLQRLRWEQRNDNTYERIAGICYLNSRLSMQIQAADLAASLFREHGERKRDDPGADPDPLLDFITDGMIRHDMKPRSDFLKG
jgi:hypothetical protein